MPTSRPWATPDAITFGPLDFRDFIPGWRSVWLADPEGNVIQVTQGFVDQDNPPPLPGE